MIWLRRVVVLLLSGLLLSSLVGGVVALDLNRSLGNPRKLETWLADSKIYDGVIASVLSQSQKTDSGSEGSGSVSLSNPVVKEAAKKAFTPELIERTVNAFLDSNYAWLSGKKATPDFKIDLTEAKQNFAEQIGKATQKHLAGLPVCTPTQLAQLPIPVDPLTVNCRPATLDPKAEGARVAQEINTSNTIVNDPVVTAKSVSQNQQPAPGTTDASSNQSQPYYQNLSWLPKAYQAAQKLPWALGLLALLSALGIFYVAVTRRRGLRRIGWVLLEAGLILLVMKFLADLAINKYASLSFNNSLAGSLRQPIGDFLRQFEPQLVQHYQWFAIGFIVIAIVIFAVLIKTRHGGSKSAKPSTPKPASAVSDDADAAPQKIADAGDVHLAHHPPPSTEEPDSPEPEPSGPPALKPLGKKPPRRKPPKLIQ